MNITVNGEPRAVAAPVALADLLPVERNGIAVAVNAVVVPRAEHTTTVLRDGDVVEIVTAVQGG